MTGVTGDTGPTGKKGAQGDTGATGPTGGAQLEYVYAYNTNLQNLNQGDVVSFNNTGPSFGLIFVPGPPSSVTVADAGVYTIEFHVRGTETTVPANAIPLVFQVNDNTILIPGGAYASEDSNPNGSHRAVTGIVTATLNAGDSITLQNVTPAGPSGPTTVKLTNDGGVVNASLRMERIGGGPTGATGSTGL